MVRIAASIALWFIIWHSCVMLRNLALSAMVLALATGCASARLTVPDRQDQFWAALSSHCGNAYAGTLVSDDAADAYMRGAHMVMHIRECSATQISIPFHIQQPDGVWDRSRTWLLTRTGTGLHLKHDHRHPDGNSDVMTLYGGDTVTTGSARAQAFAVDADSIAMFEREGRSASVTNVWHVEVDPVDASSPQFSYALRRSIATGAPADRHVRVAFDLSRRVEPPPAPWGF